MKEENNKANNVLSLISLIISIGAMAYAVSVFL